MYKRYGTPKSIAEANKVKEGTKNTEDSTVTATPSKGEQKDIFSKFASLDISSKNAFKSSFEDAIENYKNYLVGGKTPIYTGTSNHQSQLAGLVRTFQSFIG